MGNQASKSRKLPKSIEQVKNATLNMPKNPTSARATPTSSLLNNSPIKPPSDTSTMPNDSLFSFEDIQRLKEEQRTKEHAKRMGFIKLEEVPLKLDENHPSVRILRNKSRLESQSKKDIELQSKGSKLLRSKVTPDEFVAIVDDLKHYSAEQINKNYNLESNILESIKLAGLEIADTRVQLKKPKDVRSEINQKKVTKNGWTREEYEENRMNGIYHKSNNKLEDTLEQLLKH